MEQDKAEIAIDPTIAVKDEAADLVSVIPVHVTNPTSRRRIQPVIFGTRNSIKGFTYKNLPKSSLNVGLVDVPANHIGLVKAVELNKKEAFVLHPTIQKALGSNLKFYCHINGEKFEFKPSVTHLLSKDLFIHEFMARSAVGVAKLWTYTFHNHPIVHFEIAFYCESLSVPRRDISFNFSVQANKIPAFYKVHYGNVNLLINQVMDDTQGRTWKGLLGFYVPELTNMQEIETFMGEWEYPLYAMAKWDTWGPWDKPIPAINEQWINSQIASRQTLPYSQLFGHFGQIGNRTPGDTGDQGGWGTWQQYLGVGAQRSELMLFDYLAAMQDNVRPVNYFEPDGTRFKASNHLGNPYCVFWSQRVHWHPSVSSDRLGRTHDMSTINGWAGYDNQHAGGTVIGNQSILNGSMAAQEYSKGHIQAIIAQHTLPSKFPRWSTTYWEGGRGARLWMTAVMHYYATGDDEGIRHIAAQINEMFLNDFIQYDHTMGGKFEGITHPEWKIKPTSIKPPSPASGALMLYPSWTVWEDGLWAMCADTIWPILEKLGFAKESLGLKNAVYDVSKSVAMYGFHPDHVTCAIALKWNGNGEPCDDYRDPTKATFYHGYNSWVYPSLEIAKREATQRGETEVAARASDLIRAITADYYANNRIYFLQFEGVK